METSSIFDKLGGRKFVMALLVVIIAGIIDTFGKNGLTTNMIALLGTIYATFSASNAFVTSKMQRPETGQSAPTEPAAPVELPPPQGPTVQDIMPGLTNALNTVGSEIQSIKDQHSQTTQHLATLQKAVVKLMQQQGAE